MGSVSNMSGLGCLLDLPARQLEVWVSASRESCGPQIEI